jgi:hypothetical protein
MAELPEGILAEIDALCTEADALAKQGRFPEALGRYWAAYDLVPEPKTAWHATTWILVAIGDTNFIAGDYEAGRDNLGMAMHCPDAIGNPFIHLRLGQCQLELGNENRAADELARAYMGGGAEILDHEDPKYFAFVKSVLKPPPGGW